jgi:hypothetical protein
LHGSHAQLANVERLVGSFVASVFVHRYRDKANDVSALSPSSPGRLPPCSESVELFSAHVFHARRAAFHGNTPKPRRRHAHCGKGTQAGRQAGRQAGMHAPATFMRSHRHGCARTQAVASALLAAGADVLSCPAAFGPNA